jgi:hypothetical protein
LVQAFLKKWWVESDFKAPNLPLSLRLKGSGCHYSSIYNNTGKKIGKIVVKAVKKSLKISKGDSESVNRKRTDNTMVKEKGQKNKQRFTKHYTSS